MTPDLTPWDIALRIICTLAGSALIGINRGEGGRSAGLRTTMLVCLAASASMLLANSLLQTTLAKGGGFTTFDVMRLPLGVLSGMGFIGAGAILHKENLTFGVTTAASLWYATIPGLCFGSGHLGLGAILTILGLLILWAVQLAEQHWKRKKSAQLSVTMASSATVTLEQITALLAGEGYRWSKIGVESEAGVRRIQGEVVWYGADVDITLPAFLKSLETVSGVERVRWSPAL